MKVILEIVVVEKRKTHNGFKWKDVDDNYTKKDHQKIITQVKEKFYKLIQMGNIVEEYDSISLCSRETGIRNLIYLIV